MNHFKDIFFDKLRGMTFGAAGISGVELAEAIPTPDEVGGIIKLVLQVVIAIGAIIQMFKGARKRKREDDKKVRGI